MSLSKKYDIPEGKIKAMVNDGVIGACWMGREETYRKYCENLTVCKTKTEAIMKTADDMKCSGQHVWDVVKAFV